MNKFLLALSLIGALASAGAIYKLVTSNNSLPELQSEIADQFSQWKDFHSKTYTTQAEEQFRMAVFQDKFNKVNTHNAQGLSYKMEMNRFSDLTEDEFKSQSLGYMKKENNGFEFTRNEYEFTQATEETVDWRTKGAVTPVKNQGMCGSCWAFSTTGGMEGAYFLKYNKLVSFSEQQLVACSKPQGNMSCRGGLMENAFKYAESQGMESESDYPYHGAWYLWCGYKANKIVPNSKLASYVNVPKGNSDALKNAVAQQPVSIAMDASKLQSYSHGIYDEPSCTDNLDHGVQIVGYGEENGKKYWLVKNSWGASWGEKGYFRITRSEGAVKGQCGVTEDASVPSF